MTESLFPQAFRMSLARELLNRESVNISMDWKMGCKHNVPDFAGELANRGDFRNMAEGKANNVGLGISNGHIFKGTFVFTHTLRIILLFASNKIQKD